MAHKDLIGGTAYDTKGGRCLIGGTGYDIKKGRTLVGGTGYDISFAANVVITITGSGLWFDDGSSVLASVVIDGVSYTSPATVEVPIGTVITLSVTYKYMSAGTIIIDGVTVRSGPGSYEYTVNSDGAIALDAATSYYGKIAVVTAPGSIGEKLILFTVDGTAYLAKDGMTWAQWIDSNYCADSYFYYDASFVHYGEYGFGGVVYRTDDWNNVTPNEAIVNGLAYGS